MTKKSFINLVNGKPVIDLDGLVENAKPKDDDKPPVLTHDELTYALSETVKKVEELIVQNRNMRLSIELFLNERNYAEIAHNAEKAMKGVADLRKLVAHAENRLNAHEQHIGNISTTIQSIEEKIDE